VARFVTGTRPSSSWGSSGTERIRRTGRATSDEPGLAALTGRELQVARLVVDRQTNPKIASTLFLSQKTVETHLRNIFRKLDLKSRVELARVVERAERVCAAGDSLKSG
jgi:DNA-binding NarL/FixJ family response regulator